MSDFDPEAGFEAAFDSAAGSDDFGFDVFFADAGFCSGFFSVAVDVVGDVFTAENTGHDSD